MIQKLLALITLVADFNTYELPRVIRELSETVDAAYQLGHKEGKAEANAISMTPVAFQSILTLVYKRQKIAAIKAYRECTGQGLKDSKTYIDGLSCMLKGYDYEGRQVTTS